MISELKHYPTVIKKRAMSAAENKSCKLHPNKKQSNILGEKKQGKPNCVRRANFSSHF